MLTGKSLIGARITAGFARANYKEQDTPPRYQRMRPFDKFGVRAADTSEYPPAPVIVRMRAGVLLDPPEVIQVEVRTQP